MAESAGNGAVEEFDPDVEDADANASAESGIAAGAAPVRSDPYETKRASEAEDDEFDASQPASFMSEAGALVDGDDLEWAAWTGLRHLIRTREGATFLRLAEDVFVIGVMGGQPLHHDRDVTGGDDPLLSPHTWNVVAEGSGAQMLLCEVLERTYEHFPLERGSWIYLNTSNMHAVSRTASDAETVLVQVVGYGPGDGPAAMRRVAEVLAARPDIRRASEQ